MLSWYVVLGLVLVAFLLPFIFLRSQLEAERRIRLNEEAEIKLLRRSKQRLESHLEKDRRIFLKALGVAFILIRPSGRLVIANHEACELLGIEENTSLNLLSKLKHHPLHESIAHAIVQEEPTSDTVHIHHKGEDLVYQMTSTPLRNLDHHIGIVFHNMTEEHRTMVIRREFITNASHELRTPLTIIRGYLESLIEDEDYASNTKMRAHAFSLMKKHSDRILRLIEDMLTISHLENADKDFLRKSMFNVETVIEDVRLRLEPMIKLQSATCDISVLPSNVEMYGDPFYWNQVLFNLMENALKNNPEPGLILKVEAKKIDKNLLEISVIDNGLGIRPEALPFIFKRFYRADATGTVKGTGLGLSIVRNAVEAHQGKITAESEPGLRTAFIIKVPIYPEDGELAANTQNQTA